MLCYRCGSHVPDTADKCPTCGQNLSAGGLRQATGTFSRRRAQTGAIEGAPYKAQELVVSRYLIKDVVAAGPLGFVFRAHDKEIDVEVALKVINPKLVQSADERKNFAKHLRLARKLSHPNLVRVYEEGEDNDRPYFTSQFLDGLTLRKIIDLRLAKGAFFTLAEIEPILAQICSAIDGAHKVGPHSDLKPENVLVLPDLLKVTDFGLGLAMPRPPFVQAMKARKADRYLAPELVDASEIDPRADLYSLGVILGEMLTGLTPDGSMPELQRRNPEVPTAIEGIYRKAISANPNARYQTAGELFAEFDEQVKKSSPAPTNPNVPRAEPASGMPPPLRPRTVTGMLQLQPRRELKPPPPVSDLPPPPPPLSNSGEEHIPDATQPIDPAQLARALKINRDPTVIRSTDKQDRQETQVLDSEKFIASLDAEDSRETKAVLDVVAAPSQVDLVPAQVPFAHELGRRRSSYGSKTGILVVALVVLGVGVGAGGGYVLIQRQKANQLAAKEAADKAEKALAEKALADKAAETLRLERAAALKADADRAAAEKAAKDKLTPAERAAADRAERERLAAEKAAAERADRAERERLAAAERKAAAERAAAERAAALREREKEKEKVAAVAAANKAAEGGCPEGMKAVQAGAFKMGTPPGDQMMAFDEKALTSVEVGPYCIDIFEYPNKRGAPPMAAVGWADAKRLCESTGKRLCSEAEWEKACKGPTSTKWPYGSGFDANACNTEDESGDPRAVAPAGKYARCRSGFGVQDLSGNVSEWTAEKLIKGGSFASSDYAVRCSARKNSGGSKNSEVGFRCCSDQH